MRKKNIYLFWHRHNEKHGNFGDELNAYLFKKLFSKHYNIVHTSGHFTHKNKTALLRLILQQIRANQYSSICQLKKSTEFNLLFNTITIGIGSIIHVHRTDNVNVWGAGLIRKDDKISNANFLAVRGYKTIERMKALGHDTSTVKVGDPALLTPLVYKPSIKKEKIGIIPHHIHYRAAKKKYGHLPNVIIIDLLDPIESVINQICRCKYTLSSSLHGIIVSHAYGISSVWCHLDSTPLAGDNIKFHDYFSSVKMKSYKPTASDAEIMSLIQNGLEDPALPSAETIKKIQYDLLKVAPYKLNNNISKQLV